MEVLHLNGIKKMENPLVICLGFFDGVHKGHQRILKLAVQTACEMNVSSGLLTFRRHPLEIIHHGLCFPYLTNLEEKQCISKQIGLDYFIESDFTEEFSRIPPEDFVNKILWEKLNGKAFVVGKDYRFGFKARGDLEMLKKLAADFDAKVLAIKDVKDHSVRISSTGIREAIMGGNLKKAAKCLGRWYSLSGEVKKGSSRGAKMGVPTANLDLPYDRVMPRPGVYCCYIYYNGTLYQGIGHVGDKPTFDERKYNLEVHILDFEERLYGSELIVFLIKHVRDTVKFDSPEKMMVQIRRDIKECRELFSTMTGKMIKQNIPCPENYEFGF